MAEYNPLKGLMGAPPTEGARAYPGGANPWAEAHANLLKALKEGDKSTAAENMRIVAKHLPTYRDNLKAIVEMRMFGPGSKNPIDYHKDALKATLHEMHGIPPED